jgi:hypothetical protein
LNLMLKKILSSSKPVLNTPKTQLTLNSGNFSMGQPRFLVAVRLRFSARLDVTHCRLPIADLPQRSPPSVLDTQDRPTMSPSWFCSPVLLAQFFWSPRMKHVTAQVGKASNQRRNCTPQKIARQVPAF